MRRALDAGRAAAELHELFRSRSRTPVPQALTYLIDDVARRHGALRVGAAASYLRCDDEALLAAVVADRRVESLRLRRIAPTVVVGRVGVERVLEVLREAGYAPVGESAEGAVLLARPDARRATPRQRRPARGGAAGGGRRAAGRAGARDPGRRPGGAAGRGRGPGGGAGRARRDHGGDARDCCGTRRGPTRRCCSGYVNAQGSASQRIVEPVSVNGGYLHGHDHQRDEMRTFALHRITAVSALPDDVLPEDVLPGDVLPGSAEEPADAGCCPPPFVLLR